MSVLDQFIDRNVSRETFLKLKEFQRLLEEENQKINLVSRKNINECWERHILDSVIGYYVIEKYLGKQYTQNKAVVDIGSGGGLPGVPLSIMMPQNKVTLVESIRKKCTSLESFAEKLQLNIKVENKRAEDIKRKCDLITSRAVAKIEKIFKYTQGLNGKKTKYLLWKGAKSEEEINEAGKDWHFDVDVIKIEDIVDNTKENDDRTWLLIKNVMPK